MRNLRFALLGVLLSFFLLTNAQDKPNILWITCEDISPYLGSYGCKEAYTPNLDNLAARGIRYTHAYANAPVCAVARSTILTGMYASTTGTHQMRSRNQVPAEVPAYPKIFREMGYYCTNNKKQDYNSNYHGDPTLWDESSAKAHYKNREPGQPFFAVFNIGYTHESHMQPRVIKGHVEKGHIPAEPRVDPAEINLPPYHPDLPEIREDWSRLHDLITFVDRTAGDFLNELEAEGLNDNTIVFFYSDHGGMLSRSKRYIYNVGTQVPMIVYLPPKWQHLAATKPGKTDDSMVSFVDLAKTVLSLSGCDVPEQMQGRIFLGPDIEKAPEYVHFFRDRMDGRYDFQRAVTDGRYYYIRNFNPHRPLARDSRYGFQVQTNWRVWEDYYAKGLCNDIQSQFFQPKKTFELFDTKKDPWHVADISSATKNQKKLKELSDELDRWMVGTRDVGLIPEPMFADLIGAGKKHQTIYEYAQSDDYPIERILEVAKNASKGDKKQLAAYISYLGDKDPIIRYWGAYGLFLAGASDVEVQDALKELIQDDLFAANRIMAAQALGVCGNRDLAFRTIFKEVSETQNSYVLLLGLNAFQYSHTDKLLSKNDWQSFHKRALSLPAGENNVYKPAIGFNQILISDALDMWPDRRVVD